MRTIFVAFPTMHDEEVDKTIDDIFLNAKYKDRINLSVYNQFTDEKHYEKLIVAQSKYGFELQNQFLQPKNYLQYLGMTRGRSVANSKYSNEDYILQIDSHTKFAQDWDSKLINLYDKIELEKPIMTAFASFHDGDTREWDRSNPYFVYPFYHICKCQDCKRTGKPWIPNWDLEYSLADFKDRYIEDFYPCVKFNNQFAFSSYTFIKDKEKSQIGVGEDVIQSIQLFNKGYQFVYPNIKESIIGHSWQSSQRQKRAQIIGEDENLAIEAVGKKVTQAYILFHKDWVEKYAKYAGLEIYNDNELHVKIEYKVPGDYQ